MNPLTWFTKDGIFSIVNKILPTTKKEKAEIKAAAVEQKEAWLFQHNDQVYKSIESARNFPVIDFFNASIRPLITLLIISQYVYGKFILLQAGIYEMSEYDFWILSTVIVFWFGGRIWQKAQSYKFKIDPMFKSKHITEKKEVDSMTIHVDKLISLQPLNQFGPLNAKEITGTTALTEAADLDRKGFVNLYARRYEKHQHKDGRSEAEATSWGAFQIMGYNLVKLGILQDLGGERLEQVIPRYLSSPDIQIKYFNKYVAEIMGDQYKTKEQFYSLYNSGSIKPASDTVRDNVARFNRNFEYITTSILPLLTFIAITTFIMWQNGKLHG